jgi:hypothetical protein
MTWDGSWLDINDMLDDLDAFEAPLRFRAWWRVSTGSHLPLIDDIDCASSDDLGVLMEDMAMLTAADDSVIIDVGWSPQGCRHGAFSCAVVREDRAPDRLRTRSWREVVRWLEAAIKEWTPRP